MHACKNWQVVAILSAALCGLTGPRLVAEENEAETGPEPEFLTPGMLARVASGADGGDGGVLGMLELSGSLDVSYVYNWNNAKLGGPENPVRVFDRFHNEFTVQNLILNINKAATEESLWGFGFTPTVGTDAQLTQGGLDFGVGLSDVNNNVDLSVLEAYGTFRTPAGGVLGGIEIKAGKFLTTAGAEVIPSGDNAMFSRTFLFGNAIPFTHTGVIITKGFMEREGKDMVSASVGFANGWDQVRNTNDGHTLLTSATLTPSDMLSLTANWFFGSINRAHANAFGPATVSDNGSQSNLLDLVAKIEVPDYGISALLNFDWYGDENDESAVGYSDYYGLAGVLRYDFDNPFAANGDKFYLAFRGEFFDDADLFLIGGPANRQLWDLTWTLGYRPTDFLLCRFEVRYDKANANVFEDGIRSQQTTFAFNTVFTF
ncbi:MAG: outer membrane beta-barrel protein [Planctomycetota bacterium]|nr:outer membrane beta-barrel protein [Planctomycetota bacterium]